MNVTLTSVSIAPNTTQNIGPGGTVAFTASPLCTVNTTVNQTCPYAVTFAWEDAAPDLGTFNATNHSSATYTASWNALGSDAVTVDASYNNTTVLTQVGSPATTVNVFASGAPAISISYTSSFTLYMRLPFTITWTVTVGNGSIAPASTWVYLNVRDISGNCGSQFGFGPTCSTVTNLSQKVTSGNGTFSQVINYTNLNKTGYAGATGGLFPRDAYQFLVWVRDNNSAANVSAGLQQNIYPVFQAPIATFVSPLPGTSLSTGNVTFVVTYTGDFITVVNLNVINTVTKQIVYVTPMFAVGVGNRTVGATTAWLAATPGSYAAVLNVTTPYGVFGLTQNLTVIAAGQTIYINHTAASSTSLPGGLSSAATATILLVVGLIIGLIVALVLGRMMWGSPMQPASPPPWTPSSGSGSTSESPPPTDTSSGGSSSGDPSMKK